MSGLYNMKVLRRVRDLSADSIYMIHINGIMRYIRSIKQVEGDSTAYALDFGGFGIVLKGDDYVELHTS